jgi:hypothetical protein
LHKRSYENHEKNLNVDTIRRAHFAQVEPHHVCQDRGLYDQLSEACGYRKKCRDPRCSLVCLKNYMCQEALLLKHFWEGHLPSGMMALRGNLTMPLGADVESHRAARTAFLKALSRWSRKTRKTLAIRCYTHATNHYNAHYDYVAYTDATVDQIKALIAKWWRQAGGRRSTTQPLDKPAAWSVYVTKTRKKDEQRFRYVPWRPSDPHDPPALAYTWGTRGFWGDGQTRQSLWKEWCKVMYPPRMIARPITEECPITIRVNESPTPPESGAPLEGFDAEWEALCGQLGNRPVDEPMTYRQGRDASPLIEDIAVRYPDRLVIEEVAPVVKVRDRSGELLRILSTRPEEALTMKGIAARLAWPLDRVSTVMLRDGRIGWYRSAGDNWYYRKTG